MFAVHLGEGKTEARYYFAVAYAVCAAMAFAASRRRGPAVAASTRPFWLRMASICAVFAVLRSVDANMAVSAAFRAFAHSMGERPGPILMVIAGVAFGAAVVGLLLFRGRSLHPSVRGAAIAIILLVLLAMAQSVSLYRPVVFLQEAIGPVTVSRFIESVLLIVLAGCAAWFIGDANSGEAAQLPE